ERWPRTSPLEASLTIWSFPLALSLESLETPERTQYTPLSLSPSPKRVSPFLRCRVVLESETCLSSSLLMARRELNCRTMQFSHLLSILIVLAQGINLRDVKGPDTDKCHILKL